jgi:hypothetical protein
MSRRQKYPLRPLSGGERRELDRLSRSHSEPASHVARTKALVAVAQGASYTAAARLAGRKAGDAVSHLVRRFKPWCHAMGAARRWSMAPQSANVSWPQHAVNQTASAMGPPPGP